MFKEIVDPDFKYKNFLIEEQRRILAADRSNNHLDTTRLETLYPQIKNIKIQFVICYINIKILIFQNLEV